MCDQCEKLLEKASSSLSGVNEPTLGVINNTECLTVSSGKMTVNTRRVQLAFNNRIVISGSLAHSLMLWNSMRSYAVVINSKVSEEFNMTVSKCNECKTHTCNINGTTYDVGMSSRRKWSFKNWRTYEWQIGNSIPVEVFTPLAGNSRMTCNVNSDVWSGEIFPAKNETAENILKSRDNLSADLIMSLRVWMQLHFAKQNMNSLLGPA